MPKNSNNQHIEWILAQSVTALIVGGIVLALLALLVPIVRPEVEDRLQVITAFFTFAGAVIAGYLTYRTKSRRLDADDTGESYNSHSRPHDDAC